MIKRSIEILPRFEVRFFRPEDNVENFIYNIEETRLKTGCKS